MARSIHTTRRTLADHEEDDVVDRAAHRAEAARLRDEKYLDSLAQGIAEGVRAYKQKIERFGG